MPSEATGSTIPHACHAKRTLRARRPRESAFATPPVATLPHTCHVKRTRSNIQINVSPHLPRGSTLQCLPERGHASGVPRLPRETYVHHARTQHAPTPIPTARNQRRHDDETATRPSGQTANDGNPQTINGNPSLRIRENTGKRVNVDEIGLETDEISMDIHAFPKRFETFFGAC